MFHEPRTSDGATAMAKPSTVLIKMVSSAGTGTFYTTRKNSRKTTDKMTLRKYDPKIRKHVEFKSEDQIARRRAGPSGGGRSEAAPFVSAGLRNFTLTGYLNLCGKCGD